MKLLPGERLEAVQVLDLRDPATMPDPLEELCKLTGVERPEEIGLNGPAVAARVTEQNAAEAALRLFEVVFGRDSLTVALVVGDLFPRLLEATVLHLAGVQGREFDALREEEPGRMLTKQELESLRVGFMTIRDQEHLDDVANWANAVLALLEDEAEASESA